MTLVPNETEQALNHQYDVYAAAREEYRKKIAEQAAEIERLRSALERIRDVKPSWGAESEEMYEIARAALEGRT